MELAAKEIYGVTVASYTEGVVRYMDCAQAIEQRFVDLGDVSIYEAMGICFGRKPQASTPKLEKSAADRIVRTEQERFRTAINQAQKFGEHHGACTPDSFATDLKMGHCHFLAA